MSKWYKKRFYIWKLMDVGIWFICAGIVSLGGLLLGNSIVPVLMGGAFRCVAAVFHTQGLQAKYYMLLLGLILLVFAGLVVLTFTFPILILYYGISMAVRKNQLLRVTCDGMDDILYFREELRGISPAVMSLLMDLRIEGEKDLTATLLSLEQKKKIRMEDRPVLLDSGDGDLLPSEKELLKLIRENRLDLPHIAQWQRVCVGEAEKAGYIKRNKRMKGFAGRLIVLTALLIFSVSNVSSSMKGPMPFSQWDGEEPFAEALYGVEFDTMSELMDVLAKEMERPEVQSYMNEAARGIGFIVNALLAFLLPGIIFIYILAFALSRPRLVRTFKGKALAAQVMGLKNFIHDFSNLKQADKEQLALWDHFLIYAVVLEENTAIVNEIGSLWNLSLSKYLLKLS